MELDDLKEIWSAQHFDTINADIMFEVIKKRALTVRRIANLSELFLIFVNAGAASLIYFMGLLNQGWVFYAMIGWMILTALYLVYHRITRLIEKKQFDRSMLGELNQAIRTAVYQVRLSLVMRWNIVPMGALAILCLWEKHRPAWSVGFVLIMLVLAVFAGRWEYGKYVSKRRELEGLKERLES